MTMEEESNMEQPRRRLLADSDSSEETSYSNSECANYVRPVLKCRSGEIVGEQKDDSEGKLSDVGVKFKAQIQWLDLIAILYVHLGCLYGIYLLCVASSLKTYLWRKYLLDFG